MIDKELIHQAAEDMDIFEDDLTEEYERLCSPRPRILRLWPLAAAACVAGIIAIFLSPPRRTKETIIPQSYYMSREEHMQMWQCDEAESMMDVQIACQQEIKKKGERLAAYIQEQQRPIDEEY